MIEIVIKFDPQKQYYAIYEPSTDSLMVSANLPEALCILNQFLLDSGLSNKDILNNPDISYHLDSVTMRGIIEGNLKLVKRLNQAPSSLQSSVQQPSQGKNGKKEKSKGGGFAGATGFKASYKKFGSNYF